VSIRRHGLGQRWMAGVEPQTFPANEPITCRYRIWIHRGAPSAAEIKKVYEIYWMSAK
jgi:hypothetical protein